MESCETYFLIDLFQQAIPKLAQFVYHFLYFLLNEFLDVLGIKDFLFDDSQSVVDIGFGTFSVYLSALALSLRTQKDHLLLTGWV
jgi:hypothetical protein